MSTTTGKPPIASVGKIKQEQEVPGVKLPPIKGYKLDALGLNEAGENIMK